MKKNVVIHFPAQVNGFSILSMKQIAKACREKEKMLEKIILHYNNFSAKLDVLKFLWSTRSG